MQLFSLSSEFTLAELDLLRERRLLAEASRSPAQLEAARLLVAEERAFLQEKLVAQRFASGEWLASASR